MIASSLHNAQQEEKTADISLLKEKDREILPGQRIEEVLTGKKRLEKILPGKRRIKEILPGKKRLEEILPGKRRIKEILPGKRTQIRCRTKEEKQSQIQHAMEKG